MRISDWSSDVCSSDLVGAAVFAPWLAPYDTFDLSTVDLMDSEIPPIWHREGDPRFLLGTDAQGRDILSAVIYGPRISHGVGFASVVLALVLGVGLGLLSGLLGSAWCRERVGK